VSSAAFTLAVLLVPGASSSESTTLAALREATQQASSTPAPVEPPLRVERGIGFEPILIPRDETLDYVVEIDLGFLGDARVGTVSLRSGVQVDADPQAAPGASPESSKRTVGWIRSEARGGYLGYVLHEDLEVRHLPLEWPSLHYTDTQTGSENRRHELLVGLREGRTTMQANEDHHCPGCSRPEHFVKSIWPWGKPYHCEGCKLMEHRIWDESITRPTPPGSVDLLSAVYLARSMVAEKRPDETFPVLDQETLWILTVRTGEKRTVKSPAGEFSCVLVELETRVPEGEVRDKNDFSGLFGIQGALHIWMHATTGVPVQITGDMPVPVIGKLGVNVRLAHHRGTPSEFAPVR
jgi:hypothetical protein